MLSDLRIGLRLSIGFGAILLLLCAVVGIVMVETSRINDNVVDLAQNWLPSVKVLGELRAEASTARRASQRHLLSAETAEKDARGSRRSQVVDADWPKTLSTYEKLVSSLEETKLLKRIKTEWTAYLQDDNQLIALSNAGAASFD